MIKNNKKEGLEHKNFEIFYNFLIEENKKFNLTAITNKEEVFEKHFEDSISAAKLLKDNSTVLDIGAGAGFPSIPLAIVRSDLKLTLIDSLNKRINFLNQAKTLLNLNNMECFHERIEDFANKHCEKFDYVVARAVANLPTLLEYSVKPLKIGGQIIAYKGLNYEEELNLSKNAMELLGLKLEKIENYLLKNCNQTRFLLIFTKIKHTPKQFPRLQNKPRTQPL